MSAAAGRTGKVLDFGVGNGEFVRRFPARGRSIDCADPNSKASQGPRRLSSTDHAKCDSAKKEFRVKKEGLALQR